MTLEEIQKAFPIGSLVVNPADYGADDQGGRVTEHKRYYGGARDGQYYVCWSIDRSSWPERLRIKKPLSALEQSISDYIAAEKRELGI